MLSILFRLSLIFMLPLSFASSSFAADAKKPLKIASLEWVPYSSKDLKNYGFAMDIITTVLKDAGYTYEISSLPWKRVLSEVESGGYDLAACAYPSKEREKAYWMSEEFLHAPLGFFKMKDKKVNFSKIEDLKPYTIGAVRGYVNTEEFDNAKFIKKELVDRDEQNYLKLTEGRVDLSVGDRANGLAVIQKIIEKEKDPAQKKKYEEIEFMQPPLVDNTLHVLVSRALPNGEQIRNDFNKSLAKLKADGTIDKLVKSYGF